MTHHAQFEHWVLFPIERAFLFFANPQNLPRLMPPETDTRIDKLTLVAPPSPNLAQSGPVTSFAPKSTLRFASLRFFPSALDGSPASLNSNGTVPSLTSKPRDHSTPGTPPTSSQPQCAMASPEPSFGTRSAIPSASIR
jgi:hypothetical protein